MEGDLLGVKQAPGLSLTTSGWWHLSLERPVGAGSTAACPELCPILPSIKELHCEASTPRWHPFFDPFQDLYLDYDDPYYVHSFEGHYSEDLNYSRTSCLSPLSEMRRSSGVWLVVEVRLAPAHIPSQLGRMGAFDSNAIIGPFYAGYSHGPPNDAPPWHPLRSGNLGP